MNLSEVKVDEMVAEINRRILSKGTVGEGVDYLTYVLKELPREVLAAAVYSSEGEPNIKEEVQVDNPHSIGKSVRSLALFEEVLSRAYDKDDQESYLDAVVKSMSYEDGVTLCDAFCGRFASEAETVEVPTVPEGFINPNNISGEDLVNLLEDRFESRGDESSKENYANYIKSCLGSTGLEKFLVSSAAGEDSTTALKIAEKIKEIDENMVATQAKMGANIIAAYENPQMVTADSDVYEKEMEDNYRAYTSDLELKTLLLEIIEE